MTREELLNSPEYWLQHFQLDISDLVDSYRQNNRMTHKEIREYMDLSNRDYKKLTSADSDFRISKIVEILLKCSDKTIGLVERKIQQNNGNKS